MQATKDPNVGRTFRGWNGERYKCESMDDAGYWMVNVKDPRDRRNISARAIGRTFHLLPPVIDGKAV